MISTFIAYDDEDSDLGDYFEDSHKDVSTFLIEKNHITNVSIRGLSCTEGHINTILQELDGDKFIFIAISHGTPDEHVANEIFVSANNSSTFANSLFYSCACSVGFRLGDILIKSGCLSFIGYDDIVTIIEDYYPVFYQCQNFGIKSFLTNVEPIEVSLLAMREYYNIEIDRLFAGSFDDLLAASCLVNNRDNLILLGSCSVTQNDFHIN